MSLPMNVRDTSSWMEGKEGMGMAAFCHWLCHSYTFCFRKVLHSCSTLKLMMRPNSSCQILSP
jgi:hypothetical protein